MTQFANIPYREALATYPHRFTMDNIPQWAKQPAPNGKYYAPQYKSDKEWFNNTIFPTDKREKYCHSVNPSWPLGDWLDAPFSRQHKESK